MTDGTDVVVELRAEIERVFRRVDGDAAIKPSHVLEYSQSNRIRLERAVSWLEQGRAADVKDNPALGFICHWVAFEAIFSDDEFLRERGDGAKQRTVLRRILDFINDMRNTVAEKRHEHLRLAIEGVWDNVKALHGNQYINARHWNAYYSGRPTKAGKYHNPFKDADEVNLSLKRDLNDEHQFQQLLAELFQRLYYVRNMVFHGNATNRGPDDTRAGQIHDGMAVLQAVVPELVRMMLDDLAADADTDRWGRVPYPRFLAT